MKILSQYAHRGFLRFPKLLKLSPTTHSNLLGLVPSILIEEFFYLIVLFFIVSVIDLIIFSFFVS